MEKFKIKNSNLEITAIGLGSVTMGSTVDRETSFALMDRYRDVGGNLIDTAHIYGAANSSEVSRSEETIGSWLKARGCRDEIVLCTKGGHPNFDPETHFLGKARLHVDELESDLTMSLRSLQTDYVDIYLLHRDDPTLPVSRILDWLEAQRKAGRIRYYGCSNWTLERIREAQAYAAENGFEGFVVNQIAGGLAKLNDQALKFMDMLCLDPKFMQYHAESQMAVMSYMSMSNGYFQKRISGAELSQNSAFMYGDPLNEVLLEKLRAMQAQGLSVNGITYRYIMNYKFPTTALMGFSRISQLEEMIRDMETQVPQEALDELYKIRWEI